MRIGKKKFDGFDIFVFIFMICVAIVTLYPFLNVLALSFNDSIDTVRGGIYILPRKFTLGNYKNILQDTTLIHASLVSVERTVLGTITQVICCCMVAYTLSRQDYVFRKFVTMVFVITMYVSGGLIPGYLLFRNLNLLGSFWVYIIPGLVSFFNILIIRSFMDAIPASLQESARIDGANDFQIFIKIMMPLCIPAIATVSLWVAVGQWNSWFDTYLFSNGNDKMFTLQYKLMIILDNANTANASSINTNNQLSKGGANVLTSVSPDSIRMAETILTTVPILCVYPFVQKYFVKGVTLGAVKG
jgi:putative aldouronate transport system permease protein